MERRVRHLSPGAACERRSLATRPPPEASVLEHARRPLEPIRNTPETVVRSTLEPTRSSHSRPLNEARPEARAEAQLRVDNLARYIRVLLGEENVQSTALEAIAMGQVEWAEVQKAGEHWRKCSSIVIAREGGDRADDGTVPSDGPTPSPGRSDFGMRASEALRQTGAVLQQSRIRIDAITKMMNRARSLDRALTHGPSPSPLRSEWRSCSPSPLLPVPEEACSPMPQSGRRLTFSPSATPSPQEHLNGAELSPDAPTPPVVGGPYRLRSPRNIHSKKLGSEVGPPSWNRIRG